MPHPTPNRPFNSRPDWPTFGRSAVLKSALHKIYTRQEGTATQGSTSNASITRGSTKTRVFPEPVKAMPIMSQPNHCSEGRCFPRLQPDVEDLAKKLQLPWNALKFNIRKSICWHLWYKSFSPAYISKNKSKYFRENDGNFSHLHPGWA